MDEKEAIARLRVHFEIHDDGRLTPFLDKAVSVAYKSLEKQISKKPVITRISCDIPFGICPNCGKEINSLDNPFYHADKDCLQKLDWSEA